jgi:hypothetical protein
MKVIIKNATQKDWYNGLQGQVIEVDDDGSGTLRVSDKESVHLGKVIDKDDLLMDIARDMVFFDPAEPMKLKHYGFYRGIRVGRILFKPQYFVVTDDDKVIAAKNNYAELRKILDMMIGLPGTPPVRGDGQTKKRRL